MRFLLPLASVALIGFSFASSGAALPAEHLEIRVIDADRETAAEVLEALDAADQDADALAEQLDELRKRKKLHQRIRLAEPLAAGPEGGAIFNEHVEVAQVEVPKMDATRELGLDLTGDARPGQYGVTALGLNVDLSTPADRKSYQWRQLATGVEIPDRRWILAARWGRPGQDTLVLCRTSSAPRPPAENPPLLEAPVRYVRFDLELYETTASDLDTIVTKSSGREAKAHEWLKGRAELVRHDSLIVRPGQMATTKDTLFALSPEDAKNGARLPDWSPTVLPYVGPEGRLVDLEFTAYWIGEDEAGFHFSGPQTCTAGVPAFFPGEPSGKDASKSMLLVITPTVVTLFEGRDRTNNKLQGEPSGDKPYTKRYVVHPSFFRILGGGGGPDAQRGGDPFAPPIPGGGVRLPAKDALIERGMAFPEGTFVHLSVGWSAVTLKQTPAGHEAFEALLRELTPGS